MNYIGKWRFHSIGVINESGELIYLSAEEYLNSPMLLFYHISRNLATPF